MPIYMFKKINSLEEKKNNTKEIQFFTYVAFLQKKKFPLSLNQTSYLWKNMVS